MADAYACLTSLRTMLTARREDLKERMARGLEESSYLEQRGHTKELSWVLDRVNEQIKNLNGDSGDEIH